MHSEHIKLIAVFNSFHFELYETDHTHITKGPEAIHLDFAKHNISDKHSGPFEPHTMPHDLEHHNAAKMITEYLEVMLKDKHKYKELIIIGDPKTLGFVRQHIGYNSEKIMTKSIAKNLVHQDKKHIEHAVFADDV